MRTSNSQGVDHQDIVIVLDDQEEGTTPNSDGLRDTQKPYDSEALQEEVQREVALIRSFFLGHEDEEGTNECNKSEDEDEHDLESKPAGVGNIFRSSKLLLNMDADLCSEQPFSLLVPPPTSVKHGKVLDEVVNSDNLSG